MSRGWTEGRLVGLEQIGKEERFNMRLGGISVTERSSLGGGVVRKLWKALPEPKGYNSTYWQGNLPRRKPKRWADAKWPDFVAAEGLRGGEEMDFVLRKVTESRGESLSL